ncbi:MAG: hypothetical protein N2C12_11210 [Planctomycetales bacterium]
MKSSKSIILFFSALAFCVSITWAAPPSGTPTRSNRGVTPQRGSGRISDIGAQRRIINNSSRRSAGRGLRLAKRRTDRTQPPERPGQADEQSNDAGRPKKYPLTPNLGKRDTAHRIALRNRLAGIDRMRDRAIETGDTRLLEQADRLEKQTRDWFDRQQNLFVTPPPIDPLGSPDEPVTPTAPDDGSEDAPETSPS